MQDPPVAEDDTSPRYENCNTPREGIILIVLLVSISLLLYKVNDYLNDLIFYLIKICLLINFGVPFSASIQHPIISQHNF